jgi:phosphatidate cytidylyltransferase
VNLLRRLVSAAAAMAIIVALLYVGSRFEVQWIVGLMVMVVAYLASIEYLQMMKRMDIPLAAPEFLIWVPVLMLSFIFFHARYAEVVLMFAIAYQVLRHLGEVPHRTGLNQAAAGVFGLLYIPWLLRYFYLIYLGGVGQKPHVGAINALVVLLIVWGYDAGAYFVGKSLGRHKAFPTVSPNKTWEGVVGGFLLAIVGGIVGASFSPVWRNLIFWDGFYHLLIAAFLVGWAAQLGDLFASKLKRAAGVKDSGTFLPGHGGTIDRIDGLLFALPVFYFYFHYVVRFF